MGRGGGGGGGGGKQQRLNEIPTQRMFVKRLLYSKTILSKDYNIILKKKNLRTGRCVLGNHLMHEVDVLRKTFVIMSKTLENVR